METIQIGTILWRGLPWEVIPGESDEEKERFTRILDKLFLFGEALQLTPFTLGDPENLRAVAKRTPHWGAASKTGAIRFDEDGCPYFADSEYSCCEIYHNYYQKHNSRAFEELFLFIGTAAASVRSKPFSYRNRLEELRDRVKLLQYSRDARVCLREGLKYDENFAFIRGDQCALGFWSFIDCMTTLFCCRCFCCQGEEVPSPLSPPLLLPKIRKFVLTKPLQRCLLVASIVEEKEEGVLTLTKHVSFYLVPRNLPYQEESIAFFTLEPETPTMLRLQVSRCSPEKKIPESTKAEIKKFFAETALEIFVSHPKFTKIILSGIAPLQSISWSEFFPPTPFSRISMLEKQIDSETNTLFLGYRTVEDPKTFHPLEIALNRDKCAKPPFLRFNLQ